MLVNTTVSHVSPLLSYVPRSAWYEIALVQNAAATESSPDMHYHATNASNAGSASVSFSWWGKGEVYGGYQPSLGPYKVTLDENTAEYNGYTGGPSQLSFELFSASDLPLGKHSISIVNTGSNSTRPILDLGYLVFETQAGNSTAISHNSTKCVWTPQGVGAWNIDEDSHHVCKLNRTQSLTSYSGTGIAVYGQLDTNSAPFSVSIDGSTHSSLKPNAVLPPLINTTTLLYIKSNLLQGDHELWVNNDPDSISATATKLSISSVVVFSDAVVAPQPSP
ncbi:hypothetical protein C8Q77DRAFT_1198566 [Trametes polyzona]|nr:hypothetical protein C8Q77DRAFT_1198566 [Trametes polyzona]